MSTESINTSTDELNKPTSYHFSLVYAYLFVFLIVGFYFYELIGFDPLDEMFEVALVLIGGIYLLDVNSLRPKRELIVFSCIVFFYVAYSFLIHSNSPKAILIDTSVQLKPYIAFFVFYYLGVRFSTTNKKLLSFLLIGLFCISLTVVICGLGTGNLVNAMKMVYHHPARYASALVLIGLFYLYSRDYSPKTLLFFFVVISLALLSGKAKTFGFYTAALSIIAINYFKIKLKFNIKTLVLVILIVSLIVFASWEKFAFYFVDFNLDDEESLARPFLYYTSFFIFQDYFPFGSGLASFGTAASGSSYSDIYYQYDLNGIWGLNPDYPYFVADTYYPSLAQFGVFGLVLFIFFWVRIMKEALFYRKQTDDRKHFMIIVMVVMFLAIEFIADAAFTNNRGFTSMILIALCLNEMKYRYEQLPVSVATEEKELKRDESDQLTEETF